MSTLNVSMSTPAPCHRRADRRGRPIARAWREEEEEEEEEEEAEEESKEEAKRRAIPVEGQKERQAVARRLCWECSGMGARHKAGYGRCAATPHCTRAMYVMRRPREHHQSTPQLDPSMRTCASVNALNPRPPPFLALLPLPTPYLAPILPLRYSLRSACHLYKRQHGLVAASSISAEVCLCVCAGAGGVSGCV